MRFIVVLDDESGGAWIGPIAANSPQEAESAIREKGRFYFSGWGERGFTEEGEGFDMRIRRNVNPSDSMRLRPTNENENAFLAGKGFPE